jgi:predicted GIY-YIG superfamily endonuclease
MLQTQHSTDERIDSHDEGYVYVLECEDGFWYVGWSMEPETRIASHFLGRGSVCTKSHRPIRVASLIKGCKEMEDVTTIALMAQKGFRNVRGGRWLSLYMKTPPYPLQKAFSLRPPTLPELIEHKVEGEYDIYYERFGATYRAMVTGPQVLVDCPGSNVKCFRADTLEVLRSNVGCWIGNKQNVEDKTNEYEE